MPRRVRQVAGWILSFGALASLHLFAGQTMRFYALWIMLATCGGAMVHIAYAVRSQGHARRIWIVTSTALACWAFAEVSVGVTTLITGVAPGRGLIANVSNLGALVLTVVAMLMVPAAPKDRADRLRMLLDGLVSASSLVGVVWSLVLEPMTRAEGHSQALFDLAYPVLSVGVLAVSLVVLAGTRTRKLGAVHAIAGGVAVVSLALLVEIFGDVAGASWLHPWFLDGYVGAAMLVAVAPFAGLPKEADRVWQPTGLLGMTLPYLPVLAYGVICIGPTFIGRDLSIPALWAGTVTIGALMGRQFLTLRRNVTLTRALAHEANHDSLTGLPNRAALTRELDREAGKTLLMIDLDGFKAVNDTLGHTAGDRLLVEIADRLRKTIGGDAMAARLGGDEFAVVLRRHDIEDARILAARILKIAAQPVDIDGREASVRASIGIAGRSAGEDADRLLHEADLALYEAKHHGKGQYRIYDAGMSAAVEAQRTLETELGGALAAGEFEVIYSAAVDLIDEEIAGVEADVRWTRSDVDFRSAAADAGLLAEIERWLLTEAVAQLAEWRAERPDFWLSVALSYRYLAAGTVTEDVRRLLGQHGIPGEALKIRIADTAGVNEYAQVLWELRAMGVGTLLEGFGVGHTALTYLRELPVDGIKIDPMFLYGLDDNPETLSLLGAVITLIDSVGLVCVAAGVSTASQALHLRRLGCRRAHGPLFSDPVPAADFRFRHEIAYA